MQKVMRLWRWWTDQTPLSSGAASRGLVLVIGKNGARRPIMIRVGVCA
jgi:hypothetical protein